jgi:hypothetical protein
MKDCVRAAALEERALPKTKRIMCFMITAACSFGWWLMAGADLL